MISLTQKISWIGLKTSTGYNPELAKVLGRHFGSEQLGRQIASDSAVVTAFTGRLDIEMAARKYGLLGSGLTLELKERRLAGEKLFRGFGFSFTEQFAFALAGESGFPTVGKTSLLDRLHIMLKGEDAEAVTAQPTGVPAAGGGTKGGGPLLLHRLEEEKNLLAKIIDKKTPPLEVERILRLIKDSAEFSPPKDIVETRRVLRKAQRIGTYKRLAGEALKAIEGSRTVETDIDCIAEELKEIQNQMNAEVPEIALMFMEGGRREVQQGLIHLVAQQAYLEAGDSKDKVSIPKAVQDAIQMAKKSLVVDDKKRQTADPKAAAGNFSKLVVDPMLHPENGVVATGATTKAISAPNLNMLIEIFTDEKAASISKRAAEAVLASFFAGREEEVLSYIEAVLIGGDFKAAALGLEVARAIYPTLSTSDKKLKLERKVWAFNTRGTTLGLGEEVRNTIRHFEFTKRVNAVDPDAPTLTCPAPKVEEPQILPKDDTPVRNTGYVLANHKVNFIKSLVMEYFGDASERVRKNATVQLIESARFYEQMLDRIRGNMEVVGAVSAAKTDRREDEEVMIGNLSAFLVLIARAIKKGQFGRDAVLLFETEGGAGTRSLMLGVAEDVSKGGIRLGYVPFSIMSLMGAAEISFQLPNHGKGRVVLLGCDQLLKSYALFKDDYQGIRVGEKFLRDTDYGLHIMTVKAQVEGVPDGQLGYLKGLGQAVFDGEGKLIQFIEKPPLAVLREGIRRQVLSGKLGGKDYWTDNLRKITKLGEMKAADLFKEVCLQCVSSGLTAIAGNWEEFLARAAQATKEEWAKVPHGGVSDHQWEEARQLANALFYTYLNTFVMSITEELADQLERAFSRPSHDPKTGKENPALPLNLLFKKDPYVDWAQLLMEPMMIGKVDAEHKSIDAIVQDIDNLEDIQKKVKSHGFAKRIEIGFNLTERNIRALRSVPRNDPRWTPLKNLICLQAWLARKEEKEGWTPELVHMQDWIELWRIARMVEDKSKGVGVAVLDHFSDTGTVEEIFRKYMEIFHQDYFMRLMYRDIEGLNEPAPDGADIGTIMRKNIEEGACLGEIEFTGEENYELYGKKGIKIGEVVIEDISKVYIGRGTKLAAGTEIKPYTILLDAEIAQPVKITPYTVINGARITGKIEFPEMTFDLSKGYPKPSVIPVAAMRMLYDVIHTDEEKVLVVPPNIAMATVELYDGVLETGYTRIWGGKKEDGKVADHEIVFGTGMPFKVLCNLVQKRVRRTPRAIRGGK
ncbi:hypothetical protein A2276_07970 [candidate division WOR-1 bacterium RIFOXYA12_FULL_43_27]|uniref:Uncharacterized protein n=1 Tax=candidate division WOR-1 bacterium RIFOXYC2_FULL_46_14 TaxID=1802587 RepID=A0A1F4U5Y4_UNCSA|nr:MAG: hypothetical protein A2276_07970 [candidate division WOR-1 bacterium RIFOXYA12_FULL_43_27]OGC20534.1 MAG: hypothetical protein A2292_05795 [candidate division WOR-1 bacterium RIFOXYB2_FULL_46_45]OGC31729.1 MAG: hypothetical protein A2232_05655 [candidate division WOR-1 bacterium RIFOXYA2_FULL_46_56]OGC40378.1 MAG: hypothetical protein A2438_03815 [candidate division WOR-1 bacterium RIFOXYC2_FULL_46_14]